MVNVPAMMRLTSLLRPRLTFRYLLSTVGCLYVSYCIFTSQPLLSSNLPPYTGPYGVGTIDIEVPLQRPRLVSETRYKATGDYAFRLDSVLLTLYYPTRPRSVSQRPKHYCIPRPLSLQAEGYARFIRLDNYFVRRLLTFGLWATAGSNRIPADVDVPIYSPAAEDFDLLDQEEREQVEFDLREYGERKFPVYIFSHGMASSRASYTQYCGELASRGVVVAAIEHRDGSAPGSVVIDKNGNERAVFLVRPEELQLDVFKQFPITGKDPTLDREALKREQLAFRQAEVEETVKVLGEINNGTGHRVYQANTRLEGVDLRNWEGRLDFDQVILGGHSYGATLALQALLGAPNGSIPAKGGIILDPGKNSGPLNHDISVPILVVHSNSWSSKHSIFLGRPHFDVVKNLTDYVMRRTGASWFMTSLRTSHPSISDAPLLEPLLMRWTTGATINALEGLEQYVRVSMDFIDYLKTGTREGLLAIDATHPSHGREFAHVGRGEVSDQVLRYWQIHVSPPVK